MWLPNDIVAAVDAVCRIYYIDRDACVKWNEHRREGELRLLTGWCWSVRSSTEHRQGFKTMTVAYRDAYYAVVLHETAPGIVRQRLRVVSNMA